MGISGLLQLLEPVTVTLPLSALRGQTVGVDASIWLCRSSKSCAKQLAEGIPCYKYLIHLHSRLQQLLQCGITPLLVFDGRMPNNKLAATAEGEGSSNMTAEQQMAVQQLYTQHYQAEIEATEASDYLRDMAAAIAASTDNSINHSSSVYNPILTLSQQPSDFSSNASSSSDYHSYGVVMTSAMQQNLVKLCHAMSVELIVAPYEADAQLACLYRQQRITAAISEDSDLLVFGCELLLSKWDAKACTFRAVSLKALREYDGSDTHVRGLQHILQQQERSNSSTPHLFVEVCVLAGCDYLRSLPKFGLKTAIKQLQQQHNIGALFNALQHKSDLYRAALPAYSASFAVAVQLFLHHYVYDSSQKDCVMLSTISNGSSSGRHLSTTTASAAAAAAAAAVSRPHLGLKLTAEQSELIASGAVYPATLVLYTLMRDPLVLEAAAFTSYIASLTAPKHSSSSSSNSSSSHHSGHNSSSSSSRVVHRTGISNTVSSSSSSSKQVMSVSSSDDEAIEIL